LVTTWSRHVTSQEQIILTWLITKKDIDVNENERISKITLKTQIKLKEELFIAVLHFTVTIESSIMNITHYNMSVKQPLSFRSSSTAPIFQVEQHSPYPSGQTAQPLSFRSSRIIWWSWTIKWRLMCDMFTTDYFSWDISSITLDWQC
jgi:hypothetical protein